MANTNSTGQQQGNKEVERGSSEQSDGGSIQPKQTMANTNSRRRQKRKVKSEQETGSLSGSSVLADTNNEGLERGLSWGKNTEWESEQGHSGRNSTVHGQQGEEESSVESRMGFRFFDGLSTPLDEGELGIERVGSDIPERAKKLKAIGNAVVPAIPEVILRAMLRDEENEKS